MTGWREDVELRIASILPAVSAGPARPRLLHQAGRPMRCAGLLARLAAALHLTTMPDPEQLGAARTEGWIALPTRTLADLIDHVGQAGPTPP